VLAKKAEKVLRTLKQQYFLLFLYNISGNNYQKVLCRLFIIILPQKP